MVPLSAPHLSTLSHCATPSAALVIATRAVALLAFTFAVACAAALAQSPQKHPFGIDDYSALHSAHVIAVSPDGNSILYDVTADGTKGPTKHELRMIDTSGENSRKLDLPDKFRPQGFTKDGSLFGEYPVDNIAQLAIVPLAAEKPTVIITLPNGVQTALISPDGARFALLSNPVPKDPLAGVHTVWENDENRLYVVDVHGTGGAWWCPGLNSVTDFAWSHDSSSLAVIAQFPKLGHHDLHSFVNVCSASGARQLAEIPNGTAGIAWSADGQEIIFASTTTPTLTPEHVWTVSVSGGAPVDRTPQLEGTATTVKSDAQGSVWVDLHKGVISEVARFRGGKLEPAYRWPAGVIDGPPESPAFASSPETLAISVADPDHATNVAVASGAELRKITRDGDDTLANVSLGDAKIIHWTSKEGIQLEGIATFPPGFSAGTKYKFLVFPHGGPEANDTFQLDSFARFIAGMGYVVIQPEYRGSTGYGADFLSAIYQHFGDRAYRDVDSATDYAIAQGWADPSKLAIFGWSAGGFMTSWTVTQTHRYKAAIEGAGITDWLSFIPTSDIWQVDYDARLQEKDPTPMLQFSAVMHADQVTTPLLILHGEADIRVPTFQGREFFVLLRERGKTVRMVTYPGAPHFPRLAEQRRDVYKELADWLAKYNP
jgi:dipeptidyl aminopeptidase/acylaminoacyl peptidase